MSRSADFRASRTRTDGGFTLVEVIVALAVMMTVVLALLPQLVVGIRSTGVARQVTDTKGVAQGQIEQMRNLPYHIAREAGRFVDVLDRYYPNSSTNPAAVTCTSAEGHAVAPSEAATGYVPPDRSRCSYEPPLGTAFYRVVDEQSNASAGGHTIVVDTQFLSDATPPVAVTPATGYDSQTTGKDNPAASQIGMTVTVFAHRYPMRKPVTLYTQIASQPATTTRLRGRSGVRALEIGSVTVDGTTQVPLAVSAGVLNIAGSVSTASKVSLNRGAVTTALGDTTYGLSAVDNAPPQATTPLRSQAEGSVAHGCVLACWGALQLNSILLSSDDGLPVAGSATAPARAEVTSAANSGLGFGNAVDPADYDQTLGITGAPAQVVQLDTGATRSTPVVTPCAGSGSSHVAGVGYVTSTVIDVVTCAAANATVVKLFPTTAAPGGIVRIELVAATATCRVQGTTHAPSNAYDYHLVVQYWDNALSGYRTVGPVTRTTTTDLLAAIDLTSIDVGGGKKLSHYIASWSSITPGRVKTIASANVAEVSIPSVVAVATQPTRPDPTITDGSTPSVVSVTAGALSCYAEDRR